jgi:lysophospholipase L1-like esterase
MEFRTHIKIKPSPHKIRLDTPLLSIGSCFSNHIGALLKAYKFPVSTNPFGTIFNPISLFKLLLYALTDERPKESTYIKLEGVWKNMDFHSDFSDESLSALEHNIDIVLAEVKQRLLNLTYLLITPGTATVYETKTDYIVANCHKQPSLTFKPKRLLTVEEITDSFEKLYTILRQANPGIRFIFTVSPVRHIKDTLEINTISKATLLLAIKQLQEKHPEIDYFPSYEIMMDDLRDYRFYKADMLHPSEVAIQYIWGLFSDRYFDSRTQAFIKNWQSIIQAINHQPFHAQTPAYKAFISKTIEQLKALGNMTDISAELEILKQRLT